MKILRFGMKTTYRSPNNADIKTLAKAKITEHTTAAKTSLSEASKLIKRTATSDEIHDALLKVEEVQVSLYQLQDAIDELEEIENGTW
jgi:hypothetical protein